MWYTEWAYGYNRDEGRGWSKLAPVHGEMASESSVAATGLAMANTRVVPKSVAVTRKRQHLRLARGPMSKPDGDETEPGECPISSGFDPVGQQRQKKSNRGSGWFSSASTQMGTWASSAKVLKLL